MQFHPTPLAGAWLLSLEPRADDRGSFARTFCTDEFAAHGIDFTVVQANESVNRDVGTVRGMHYQHAPHAEAKVVRCTRGALYDVIVDLREGSPTRYAWYGVELTGDDDRQLFVPEGFAHGYQVLAPDTTIQYLMGARYAPDAADGLRFDDPALGIDWPLGGDPRLSPRDAAWPRLRNDSA